MQMLRAWRRIWGGADDVPSEMRQKRRESRGLGHASKCYSSLLGSSIVEAQA